MDETRFILSILGSINFLAGRDDMRDYEGAHIEQTTITAIKCIGSDGRYLKPTMIWPATTYPSNWTIFSTPEWHYTCFKSGYTDFYISLEWLKRVFHLQTEE